MRFSKRSLLASGVLTVFALLAVARPAAAQGAVTPSFGGGMLVLDGEGYRAGERVEITVRVGGASHPFTATADGRGRFRLETGLTVPPMSSIQIEARDERGMTQATTTSAPGSPGGAGAGAPLPPAPGGGAPLPSAPASPQGIPSQLPRVGTSADMFPLLAAGGAGVLLAGLRLLFGPRTRPGRRRR